MRKLFSSFAFMLFASVSNAQTTATNWTANDCNSVSHTLFTELDAGKIVVFVWVMPCNSCVSGAKAAYDAAQSFATSHPGKVLYYVADDFGNSSCTTVTNWITANSIGATSNMTIFGNAGNVIDENDFGGTGMPHVVVMGGTDHKIYYNKKNSLTNDLTGITAAINTAITTLSTNDITKNTTLSITPNPVQETLTVTYPGSIKSVVVTSVTGQVVIQATFSTSKTTATISMADIAAGVYFVKVVDTEGKSFVREITKQ